MAARSARLRELGDARGFPCAVPFEEEERLILEVKARRAANAREGAATAAAAAAAPAAAGSPPPEAASPNARKRKRVDEAALVNEHKVRIAGDGACLYRALAQFYFPEDGLTNAGVRKVVDLLVDAAGTLVVPTGRIAPTWADRVARLRDGKLSDADPNAELLFLDSKDEGCIPDDYLMLQHQLVATPSLAARQRPCLILYENYYGAVFAEGDGVQFSAQGVADSFEQNFMTLAEAIQHAAELAPDIPPIVLLHNGRHFDASVIPLSEWRAYVASREPAS